MRLLNTKTLEFEEFIGEVGKGIPHYAILSHTWEQEEVTYKDHCQQPRPARKGYAKVLGSCDVAQLEGFAYMWIDTCCIDKSSSAELSEAINSMFQWYRDASICYAYLSDVDSSDDPDAEDSSFSRSRWFTRGFTLQELLAPTEVAFLASDWSEIGSKKSLRSVISRITRINERALHDGQFSEYSVAQKMSWAANRKTTRVEDEAYCLMGLFDVNMPLLYGEGHKAFSRLQQEIWKQSEDQSIFAWSYSEGYHSHLMTSGLMAPSAECFNESSRVEITKHQLGEEDNASFEVIGRLIRMRLRVMCNVEAIKLRLVKRGPLLYEIMELQRQQDAKRLQDRQVPVIAQDTASDYVVSGGLSTETIRSQFTSPEIVIDTEEMVSQSATVHEDARPRITFGSAEPVVVEPPTELETSVELDRTDADDVRSLSPDADLPDDNGGWRWYIYEPVMIVPLCCRIGTQRLCILLTQGATGRSSTGIFSRLHFPSIIGMRPALENELSAPLSLYATMSSKLLDADPSQPLGSRSTTLSWPDIRVAALLRAGYVPSSNAGPNWVMDRQKAAIVHQNDVSMEDSHSSLRNDFDPLVLFHHTSGDSVAYPMFFFSIARNPNIYYRGYSLEQSRIEVGIFGANAVRARGLDYTLYRFNVVQERQVGVPLGQGRQLVVRIREGPSGTYVTLSLEPHKRSVLAATTVAMKFSNTESLQLRLFAMVRSLR